MLRALAEARGLSGRLVIESAGTHGWLVRRGRIVGLVDPAIYHANPEIELAFATLFGSLGEPFFRRYNALSPLRPGFFEARRHIYNLYPLLVHARLFGGHYAGAVERTLARIGG